MTLEADWRGINRDRQPDSRYPASLTLQAPGSGSLHLNVQLAKRGKSRRDKMVCEFPPLKVFLDREQVKGTTLRGNSSLKLVTHCNDSKRYASYYVKEYLAYRFYNELTPLSFRVRSLKTTYSDSKGKAKPLIQFAFFIEDVDDVASRNDLREQVTGDIWPGRLDGQTMQPVQRFPVADRQPRLGINRRPGPKRVLPQCKN